MSNYRVIGPDSWHTQIAACQILEGSPKHVVLEKACIVPNRPRASFVISRDGEIISASRTVRHIDPVAKSTLPRPPLRRLREAKNDSRTCVFLGPLIGQYGHFLLESLSRTWYRTQEDVVYAFSASPIEVRTYMLSLWRHLGIEPRKLLLVSTPTRFNRIVIPEPAFSLGRYVFTCLRDVYVRIARNTYSEPQMPSERIYLSRSQWEPTCNEKELEEALAGRGFRILHPQDLSIEEQIAAVGRAREIVGRGGSAMHNVVFAQPGVKITHLFAHDFRKNYYLTDQLAQADATYALVDAGRGRGVGKIDIDRVLDLVDAS